MLRCCSWCISVKSISTFKMMKVSRIKIAQKGCLTLVNLNMNPSWQGASGEGRVLFFPGVFPFTVFLLWFDPKQGHPRSSTSPALSPGIVLNSVVHAATDSLPKITAIIWHVLFIFSNWI